jgi:PleD family two-component response regulator
MLHLKGLKAMDEATTNATVLIANDQEWSARSLESIFVAEGYSVLRAFTGNQAIQKAGVALPDVIILDRQMPDLDGAEVCRRLRADPRFGTTTPILITTAGHAGRAQRLEAFEAGAWDFIGQPIDGEIILHKVRTFLQAKQAADRAVGAGYLDPGTGLYTKLGFDRRAREVSSEARRSHLPVACVVFVADAPQVESALESAEGVAQNVAEFFKQSGRTADVVGRLGPLRFGVIAPATSSDGAARMVERVEAALSEAGALSANGGRISLRAGYYSISDFAEEPLDPDDLLARASATLSVLS